MPKNANGRDSTSAPSVDGYIASLDERRAAVVGALRAVVVAAAPDADEGVARGRAIYSRDQAIVCHIAAHANHVKIGFPRGVELRDPTGLLTGTGKGMRHLKCRELLDIPTEAIRAMVRQAWALGDV